MYIHSHTILLKAGVLMKYCYTYSYNHDEPAPHGCDKAGGKPDHTMPQHKLVIPSDTARQQGDKANRFSGIDMEIANYFHPIRY